MPITSKNPPQITQFEPLITDANKWSGYFTNNRDGDKWKSFYILKDSSSQKGYGDVEDGNLKLVTPIEQDTERSRQMHKENQSKTKSGDLSMIGGGASSSASRAPTHTHIVEFKRLKARDNISSSVDSSRRDNVNHGNQTAGARKYKKRKREPVQMPVYK